MFFEACILAFGLQAGETLYKKIRNRIEKSRQRKDINSNQKDIAKLSSAENQPVKNELRRDKRYLYSALIATGLSLYPPFFPLAFICYFYACLNHFKKSWNILKQFKVTVEPLASFFFLICLLNGFLFEGSMAIAVYYFIVDPKNETMC